MTIPRSQRKPSRLRQRAAHVHSCLIAEMRAVSEGIDWAVEPDIKGRSSGRSEVDSE